MKKFGWIPDSHDQRDRHFTPKAVAGLPALADFRNRYPRVWDQDDLGSCTAQAVAAAALYADIYDEDTKIVVPSRLFIYWMTRYIEGTVERDVGAMIRNAIKAVVKFGYPVEDLWPYVIREFKTVPSEAAQKAAWKERIKAYERVDRDLNHFREILSAGYPIILGFSVYDSIFRTDVRRTGGIPVPKRGEKLQGGHAVLACGYDDNRQALIIRNSWGEHWGEKGYGYLPYAFIESSGLSADFWTIQ